MSRRKNGQPLISRCYRNPTMGLDEYESKLSDGSHPTQSALDRSAATAKSLIYKPQGGAKRYQGEIVVLPV